MEEELVETIKQEEMVRRSIHEAFSDYEGIDDTLYRYAAIPDGIPSRFLERLFGLLNKQLALANWSDVDVENIEEEIAIQQIREIHKKKRYELRQLDDRGWSQVWILSKALSTLGKEGFLLKQASTTEKRIVSANSSGGSSWFPISLRR